MWSPTTRFIPAFARPAPRNRLQDTPQPESKKTDKAKRSFLVVWTIVGGILLTAVLVYLFNILSVPVGIVIWATVIVFCLRGPVNKLEKLGVPRVAGTTIAYVLMFLLLGYSSSVMGRRPCDRRSLSPMTCAAARSVRPSSVTNPRGGKSVQTIWRSHFFRKNLL